MKISIAGAGAGKTTKMAEKIIESHERLAEHLNIYCIAFTNNAAEHIANKLSEHFGELPKRIKVSTIHSFLYQEIIRPYYFLIYGKQYEKISHIELPEDAKLKNWKISQLDKKNIIHIDSFSQKALWVMVKKSSDRKAEKDLRKVVQKEFIKYCGAIFIDEAQDIDNNVFEIVKQFNAMGIALEIMGDPKQDLKGFGNLRKLVDIYPQSVEYITECHRCPQIHLDVSNKLIADSERQKSCREIEGRLSVIYETDIDVEKFFMNDDFDLKYISAKNEMFETHKVTEASNKLDTLYHELVEVVEKLFPDKSRITIERVAYFWSGKLLKIYDEECDAEKAMGVVFKRNRLENKDYARIIQIVQHSEIEKKGIYVNSIESIKGREGCNCLFIVTVDLAEYLWGKKKDNNKTKNKLYVALTRSLENLTILVTKEVEEKYGRDVINNLK